jgi:hypothetical protein
MPYSMAGIDVHKKVLIVVVAEVTEQAEWSYERGKFGATSCEFATFSRLVPTAGRAGSGDGVYRAILETGVGRTGAVLDAGDAATGRRRAHGREAPLGPSPVQSRPGAGTTIIGMRNG